MLKRLRCLYVFNDNKINFIYDIATRMAYIFKKNVMLEKVKYLLL